MDMSVTLYGIYKEASEYYSKETWSEYISERTDALKAYAYANYYVKIGSPMAKLIATLSWEIDFSQKFSWEDNIVKRAVVCPMCKILYSLDDGVFSPPSQAVGSLDGRISLYDIVTAASDYTFERLEPKRQKEVLQNVALDEKVYLDDKLALFVALLVGSSGWQREDFCVKYALNQVTFA